jgi:CRISPR/Cas system CSM-associated protein Csm3 (group 7 of RAMP superfamily)
MSTGSHVITGKVLFFATLQVESPLLMGRGNGEWVDKEVMRLPDGRPYIPASSFAGSLRSLMKSEGLIKEGEQWLWGTPVEKARSPRPAHGEQSYQSHLIIHDLVPTEGSGRVSVVKRDGIRISHTTNTVEAGKKYDYEAVEPGACFRLTAELTIRSTFLSGRQNEVEGLAIRIMEAIHHVRFRLGAFTSQGFGKVRVSDPNIRYFRFPSDSEAWFRYLDSGVVSDHVSEISHPAGWKQTGDYPFSVVARFRIKSAMMVGAPGDSHSKADKSSIKSNGNFVLPGKSIRGALRHRAQRIMNIIHQGSEKVDGIDITSDLFGFVAEGGDREGNAVKGRFLVEESVIEKDAVTPKLQNRIRIDRFTGGVINSGLFNSEPIWTTHGESIEIAMHILKDATKMDKRLLLLLLKDLWTGDLPIGGEKNIGRGVLKGMEACIYESGKQVAHFKRIEEPNNTEAIDVEFGTEALEMIMQTEQTV